MHFYWNGQLCQTVFKHLSSVMHWLIIFVGYLSEYLKNSMEDRTLEAIYKSYKCENGLYFVILWFALIKDYKNIKITLELL